MQKPADTASKTEPKETEPIGFDPSEVCTLSESGMAERLAWVQQNLLPHVLRTERVDGGIRIEFPRTPQLAQTVDHLIQLESECCAEIAFKRSQPGSTGPIALEIHGIDPNAEVLRPLVVPQEGGNRSRLFQSAAAGLSLSFLVCCILPMGAMALLGASVGSFASLDSPAPIALGAVISGIATWWWLGRRARRQASSS